MAEEADRGGQEPPQAEIRTFLIADVRGYVRVGSAPQAAVVVGLVAVGRRDGLRPGPVFNPGGIDLVSRRVKNYQHSPQWGLLVDQLWVR